MRTQIRLPVQYSHSPQRLAVTKQQDLGLEIGDSHLSQAKPRSHPQHAPSCSRSNIASYCSALYALYALCALCALAISVTCLYLVVAMEAGLSACPKHNAQVSCLPVSPAKLDQAGQAKQEANSNLIIMPQMRTFPLSYPSSFLFSVFSSWLLLFWFDCNWIDLF